jgi:hypothetical protein
MKCVAARCLSDRNGMLGEDMAQFSKQTGDMCKCSEWRHILMALKW